MQEQLPIEACCLASRSEEAESRPDIVFDERPFTWGHWQFVFQPAVVAFTVSRATNSWKFPILSWEIFRRSQAPCRRKTSGHHPYGSVPGLESCSDCSVQIYSDLEWFLSSCNQTRSVFKKISQHLSFHACEEKLLGTVHGLWAHQRNRWPGGPTCFPIPTVGGLRTASYDLKRAWFLLVPWCSQKIVKLVSIIPLWISGSPRLCSIHSGLLFFYSGWSSKKATLI